ncbi:hypothetical protein TNCV_3108601 [Trichonephila clavipes]|uniref:Uncharacterized protein n=1 Tax=Trichonephila clavipes TaxID=2585209 RepID=A0A8X6S5P1_TRICX|nr:hypothetical protein TNCV_3108601 [Trichonephila clavipes]
MNSIGVFKRGGTMWKMMNVLAAQDQRLQTKTLPKSLIALIFMDLVCTLSSTSKAIDNGPHNFELRMPPEYSTFLTLIPRRRNDNNLKLRHN